jgi:hypothetical protein
MRAVSLNPPAVEAVSVKGGHPGLFLNSVLGPVTRFSIKMTSWRCRRCESAWAHHFRASTSTILLNASRSFVSITSAGENANSAAARPVPHPPSHIVRKPPHYLKDHSNRCLLSFMY